jgi:hypothetical protein
MLGPPFGQLLIAAFEGRHSGRDHSARSRIRPLALFPDRGYVPSVTGYCHRLFSSTLPFASRQAASKDMDRLVVQRLIQPTFLSNPVVKKK